MPNGQTYILLQASMTSHSATAAGDSTVVLFTVIALFCVHYCNNGLTDETDIVNHFTKYFRNVYTLSVQQSLK